MRLMVNEILQCISEKKDQLSEFDKKFTISIYEQFKEGKKITGKQYYALKNIMLKIFCEEHNYMLEKWIEKNVKGCIDFSEAKKLEGLKNDNKDEDAQELEELLNL